MSAREEYRNTIEHWMLPIIQEHPEIGAADALWETIRGTDLYVPRSVFREVWQEAVIQADYIPLLNRLPDEATFPIEKMRPTTKKMKTEFVYIGQIRGSYIGLPGRIMRTVGITSNTMLTLGEIRQEIMLYASKYEFDTMGMDFNMGITLAYVRE